MKLGKIINHKIVIEPSANEGFIAKVGCGTFVFSDKKSLIAAMEEYLQDPEKWEKEYNQFGGPVPMEQPTTMVEGRND